MPILPCEVMLSNRNAKLLFCNKIWFCSLLQSDSLVTNVPSTLSLSVHADIDYLPSEPGVDGMQILSLEQINMILKHVMYSVNVLRNELKDKSAAKDSDGPSNFALDSPSQVGGEVSILLSPPNESGMQPEPQVTHMPPEGKVQSRPAHTRAAPDLPLISLSDFSTAPVKKKKISKQPSNSFDDEKVLSVML